MTLTICDIGLLAMAKSDAKFDGRSWLGMSKGDKRRYLERSLDSMKALGTSSPEMINVEMSTIVGACLFCPEAMIEAALEAKP